MSNKPLNPDLIETWKNSRRETSKLEKQIFDRITYIIEVWFKAFGGKLNNWYFQGAGEGKVGNLSGNMSTDCISSILTFGKPNPKPNESYSMVIIDKYDEEYSWQSEIPIRWLFDPFFKDEIVSGKRLFDEKEIARKATNKAQRAKQKETDQSLIKAVKQKLTKEELAALKRSL